MNHDYDKVLKNRIHDKSVPVRDTYQQLKTAQKKKDEVVQYKLGDAVTHPKFGHGIVEKINQRSGGVHLHIRFDGEVKCNRSEMAVAEEVYVKRFSENK